VVPRIDRLAALGRRTRQVVLLSALTGLATGAIVALFEWITREQLFAAVRDAPTGVQVGAPALGLVLAALVLRRTTPSTADEYIRNFHEPNRRLEMRPVVSRTLASIATLGLGGAMGYEGPAIYLGAATGSALQRRLTRFFSREDAKVLLVCGAAAGVAAIFKAPATGLVFALEVPYQEDVARRMLLPAGMAAAVSYVTFVSLTSTTPLFSVRGTPPFDLPDLLGAAVLGVCCGLGARGFAIALVWAKELSARVSRPVRTAVAAGGLAALAALSFAVYDQGLTLGAGYDTLEWAFDPRRSVGLVLLLLLLRTTATLLTVAGGGVGGVFIPLVVAGGLVGRALSGLFRSAAGGSSFFPLVGVAAFLGAGYRVPLAGVMFAAETTGRPGFIVPGVIASMVAQLFMGRTSVSPYQLATRAGHLERRFSLPLTAALRTDVPTVPPDTTVEEFVWVHALGNRQQAVPVVDGSSYLGMMRLDEATALDRDTWAAECVGDHLRADFPAVPLSGMLRAALVAMEGADVDLVAVVDGDTFVGVVTTDEVLRLDEILERGEEL
jgi:CIC family chloride channel protein